MVQYGETWRVYDEDGNDLMGERFQDVRFIGEFLELKNMDGECGVIDEKGNVGSLLATCTKWIMMRHIRVKR